MYYRFTKEANKNVEPYGLFVPDNYFIRMKKWGCNTTGTYIILQLRTQVSSEMIVFFHKIVVTAV